MCRTGSSPTVRSYPYIDHAGHAKKTVYQNRCTNNYQAY